MDSRAHAVLKPWSLHVPLAWLEPTMQTLDHFYDEAPSRTHNLQVYDAGCLVLHINLGQKTKRKHTTTLRRLL